MTIYPVCSFDEAITAVEALRDEGCEVEPLIKRLVAALWMFGVKTTMSCEGHFEHEIPHVDCDIESWPIVGYLLGQFNESRRKSRYFCRWCVSPFPDSFMLHPEGGYLPLAQMQTQAESFAKFLIRLADVLRQTSEPPSP